MKNVLLLLPLFAAIICTNCEREAEQQLHQQLHASMQYAQEMAQQQSNLTYYGVKNLLEDEAKAKYRPLGQAMDSVKMIIRYGQDALWSGIRALEQPEEDRGSPLFLHVLDSIAPQLNRMYSRLLHTHGEAFDRTPEDVVQLIKDWNKLTQIEQRKLDAQLWFQLSETEQYVHLHQLQMELDVLTLLLMDEIHLLTMGSGGCWVFNIWNTPRLYPLSYSNQDGEKLARVEFAISDWDDEFSDIHLTANGNQLYPEVTLSAVFSYPTDADSVTLAGYYQYFRTGDRRNFDATTYSLQDPY